jgi:hypothetical protein
MMSIKLAPLATPAKLSDGSEFLTWEQPPRYGRTLHVNPRHPQSGDANPGTEERPFRIHRPEENMDLATWREFHGQDVNSVKCDVTVEFNPETLELACAVDAPPPACPVLPEASITYGGAARGGTTTVPGPFASLTGDRRWQPLAP